MARAVSLRAATAIVAAFGLAACAENSRDAGTGPGGFLAALGTERASPAAAAGPVDKTPKRPDKRVALAAGDAEMDAASDRARRAIPSFFALLDGDAEATGLVKIRFETPKGLTVHAWMTFEAREGEFFVGRLANSGGPGDGYAAGDRRRAKPDAVTDWMVIEAPRGSGAIHGAYTLRVLAKRAPGLVDQAYLARLKPLPAS